MPYVDPPEEGRCAGPPLRRSFAITPSKDLEAAWAKIMQRTPLWFAQQGLEYNALYCLLRGTTYGNSVPTVVVKTSSCVSAEMQNLYKETVVVPSVNEEQCEQPEVEFLIGSVSRLWGWMPENPGSSGTIELGIGVGRVGNTRAVGTLGGYLRDRSNPENVFGLTTHHVVNWQENESEPGPALTLSDAVKMESPAGFDLAYEQMHIADDWGSFRPFMEEAEALEKDRINKGAEPSGRLSDLRSGKARIDDRQQKLDALQPPNNLVGTVFASSGTKTVKWDQSNPRDSFTSAGSYLNMDWAIIKLSGVRRVRNSSSLFPYYRKFLYDVSDSLETGRETITARKIGRSSGHTEGWTSGLRAQVNLEGVPNSVEMTAVKRGPGRSDFRKFIKEGDSGAWILDIIAQALGLLIGGDLDGDIAFYTPFDLLLKDIRQETGLDLEVMFNEDEFY